MSSDDDDDDEDAWYNLMEQNAKNQTDCYDDLNSNNNKQSRFQKSSEEENSSIEEDEYFSDIVNHINHNTDSIIASEEHSIWQQIIRDMTQDTAMARIKNNIDTDASMLLEVEIEDSSVLLSMQNWLFGFLPNSSKLYTLLSNIINDTCQHRQHIFTNHYSHPSILVIFHHIRDSAIEMSVFSPTFVDANLFSKVCNTVQCHQSHFISNICLSAIDSWLFENYVVDHKDWDVDWTEHCGMFVHSAVGSAYEELLPLGYELRSLR